MTRLIALAMCLSSIGCSTSALPAPPPGDGGAPDANDASTDSPGSIPALKTCGEGDDGQACAEGHGVCSPVPGDGGVPLGHKCQCLGCLATGECVAGTSAKACGWVGKACVECEGDDVCVAGSCRPPCMLPGDAGPGEDGTVCVVSDGGGLFDGGLGACVEGACWP